MCVCVCVGCRAKTLASSGGCIIFVDEIDALASSRDDMKQHEASKRILSVLLRKLDGFDTLKDKTMLICASNRSVGHRHRHVLGAAWVWRMLSDRCLVCACVCRKQDLDDAFLSRVDSSIYFPLPDSDVRSPSPSPPPSHTPPHGRMCVRACVCVCRPARRSVRSTPST